MLNKVFALKYLPFALLGGLYFFWQDIQAFSQTMLWCFALFALGVVFLPTADLALGRFRCRGYMFARVLGLALAGWLSWTLSAVRILPFRTWACFLVIAVALVVNLLINRKTKTYERYISDDSLFASAANKEALFIALQLFWTYIRALRPEIEGLEKFMEFGFINSLLRSDWMPAPDMWLAGEGINYYYLGHFMTAFMTRLTFIHPAVTYNLMMASLFSISFMLAYGIGGYLVKMYLDNAEKVTDAVRRRAEMFGGLLSGAVVTLSGNLHSMVYGVLYVEGNERGSYWFPDATRYIGFNPPVEGDGTIHEFPLYSYVVADLHAHVINMIFVLTALAVILSVATHLLRKKQTLQEMPWGPPDKAERSMATAGITLTEADSHIKAHIKQWLHPGFVVVSLLIGLFTAINFWDYPIYVVVTGAMLLYANLKIYGFCARALLITAAQTVAIAIAAYVLTLPFHLAFESMATGINLTSHRSMLHQLLILWGYQLFFGVALTLVMLSRYKRITEAEKGNGETSKAAAGAARGASKTAKGKTKAKATKAAVDKSAELYIDTTPMFEPKIPLFRYIEKANPADAMAFILFICATGLFIIPEIIYVVDIYGGQPRANTMFKLGYQAYIMFALGTGYAMVRLCLAKMKYAFTKSALILIGLALLGSAFVYPFFAVTQWYGKWGERPYEGLDGTKYMQTLPKDYKAGDDSNVRILLSDDYELVQFINDNITGSPVLAEAMGDSYTINGRISANTGLPNILNWYYHEVLWRYSEGVYEMVGERRDDANNIYRLGDADAVRGILAKYDVRYIVVGEVERRRYPELDEALLQSLGEIIFTSGDLYMIEVEIG